MVQDIAVNTQFQPTVDISAREEWLKRLNAPPQETKKQQDYKNIPDRADFDTIPIGILENMLDEVYMGLWKTENLSYQVVANEIVGSLELSVFDPSGKVWITRVGTGAVTIRQKKDAALTDIGSKIKTALQMDFAKLNSVLLKNAAKTLGKRFGRDLNRKFEDIYEAIYSNEAEVTGLLDELKVKFSNCKTVKDLGDVWASYPQFKDNSAAKKLFNAKKVELQHGATGN